jgi:uncharacterized membrane protein
MHAMNENAPPRSPFEKLLLRSYEYHHRRLFWGVRFISGIVLLGVGIFVLSYGSWWAVPFLAGAGADFVVGYRIYQATKPASDVVPTRA